MNEITKLYYIKAYHTYKITLFIGYRNIIMISDDIPILSYLKNVIIMHTNTNLTIINNKYVIIKLHSICYYLILVSYTKIQKLDYTDSCLILLE